MKLAIAFLLSTVFFTIKSTLASTVAPILASTSTVSADENLNHDIALQAKENLESIDVSPLEDEDRRLFYRGLNGLNVLVERLDKPIEVVTGGSFWYYHTTSTRHHFGSLEILGVEKSAEDNAMENCRSQNLANCQLAGSEITRCNIEAIVDGSWAVICEARATVTGFAEFELETGGH